MDNNHQALLNLIESSLAEHINNEAFEEPLLAAVNHSVFPAGKRIRPLITLILASDLNIPIKELLNKAVAIELLHCSSLIHDDLPALDNDDFRRGRPACHKAFGEATAILAGDALIALALKAASKPSESKNFSADLFAVNAISEAFLAVCRGQQLDLLNYADLEKMQSLKTGALFACSVKLPALYLDRADQLILKLENFGYKLGSFFQHADDYLDIWGSNSARGRSQSSDLKNGKITKVTGQKQDQALMEINILCENLTDSLSQLSLEFEPILGERADFKGLKSILELLFSRF